MGGARLTTLGRTLKNGCLGRLTEVVDEARKINIGSKEKPVFRYAVGLAELVCVVQYLFESDMEG